MSVIKNAQYQPVEVHGIKIHELANMVPMASPLEQEALRDSIERNGQREPIILYRGSIVDGRCRALACENLGIDVDQVDLPHKMPLKEVKKMVMDLNTRRNLNTAQKAIIAVRAKQGNPGMTARDVGRMWGVRANEFSCANYLLKHRPDLLDILFEGGLVAVEDGKQSRSISTIKAFVARQIEDAKSASFRAVGIDNWDGAEMLVSQEQKDRFKEAVEQCGYTGGSAIDAKAALGVIMTLVVQSYPL